MRVEYGDALAVEAVDPQRVAVSLKVADVIQSLAAHGFRLTAHTRAEAAVTRAAIAKTAGGSSTSMLTSESVKAAYVHILFCVGKVFLRRSSTARS